MNDDEMYFEDQVMRELKEEESECSHCKKMVPHRTGKVWVTDRYNIPYKKVCFDCREAVEEEISGYVFDAGYAGESLDGE